MLLHSQPKNDLRRFGEGIKAPYVICCFVTSVDRFLLHSVWSHILHNSFLVDTFIIIAMATSLLVQLFRVYDKRTLGTEVRMYIHMCCELVLDMTLLPPIYLQLSW